jgi:K+-transporting ATPase c subunit
MLKEHVFSPGNGQFGEPIVKVLEVNLDLRKRYGAPS